MNQQMQQRQKSKHKQIKIATDFNRDNIRGAIQNHQTDAELIYIIC